MKLNMYEETQKTEEVYIRLKTDITGVVIHAVDSDGNKFDNGNLITIRRNGTLKLHLAINKTLGFQIDDNGKLKVT